jgi:hypothetical protein
MHHYSRKQLPPFYNNMATHFHSKIIDLQFQKMGKQYICYSHDLLTPTLIFLVAFMGFTTTKLKSIRAACPMEICTSPSRCPMGQQLPTLKVNVNGKMFLRTLHIKSTN